MGAAGLYSIRTRIGGGRLNDFGISLPRGTRGLYKRSVFFNPKASDKERIFIMESGPGMEPTPGSRKITGRWEIDGAPDTLDSYSFSSVMVNGKRFNQLVTGDPVPEPVPVANDTTISDTEEEQKPVRRKR
jgi:hypothetical protein